jgi:hypothetical protein
MLTWTYMPEASRSSRSVTLPSTVSAGRCPTVRFMLFVSLMNARRPMGHRQVPVAGS